MDIITQLNQVDKPKIDYYGATLPNIDSMIVVQELCDIFNLKKENVRECRGQRGYTSALSYFVTEDDQEKQLFRVSAGMPGNESHTHIDSYGSVSGIVSDVLKESYPDHRCSRVDSCIDYLDENAWEILSTLCCSIKEKYNLQSILIDSGSNGSTYYLGSRTSVTHLRLYQKGNQLRSVKGIEADPNLIRIELEVKAKSKNKHKTAKMTAEQLWGCSEWAKEMYKAMTDLELAREKIGTVKQFTSLTKREKYLAKQYGPTIKERLESLNNDPCALGNYLIKLINKDIAPNEGSLDVESLKSDLK